MSKRTKWSGAAAILAIVLIGVTTAAKGRNKATEVRIEPVEKRDLVAAVTASGQVQPHTKVDIIPDIGGKVVRLAVKEGDLVTRGQFLVEIDPSQYQAAVQRSSAFVASSRAQLARAKPALDQAQRNYTRLVALKKANPTLVSDEQVEQMKTQLDVSQADYESAQHSIDQAVASLRDANSSLSKTTLVAPMSGRVTRLNAEIGATAVPGTFNKESATLLTISDMSVLETKVKVDETDVSRIALGDSAVVQIDAYPDTTFLGRVTQISNSSVRAAMASSNPADQAINYEVTIQLLNAPPTVRPDFSATAKIVTDQRKNVLSIPIIALTVREDETQNKQDTVGATLARVQQTTKQVGKRDIEGVFVVGKNNKVAFRPVKVGIAGEKYFEVVSGLKAGEKIVGGTYQAIRELKDGALVRETKIDTKKKDSGKKS
jgi:HlyD family secretion protein